MSNIQYFNFQESQEVGTLIDDDGYIWFVTKDICEVLDIPNSIHYIDHVLNVETLTQKTLTIPSQNRTLNIINEYGLYLLISNLNKYYPKGFNRQWVTKTEAFKQYVTSEILPNISIRDALGRSATSSEGGRISRLYKAYRLKFSNAPEEQTRLLKILNGKKRVVKTYPREWLKQILTDLGWGD